MRVVGHALRRRRRCTNRAVRAPARRRPARATPTPTPTRALVDRLEELDDRCVASVVATGVSLEDGTVVGGGFVICEEGELVVELVSGVV